MGQPACRDVSGLPPAAGGGAATAGVRNDAEEHYRTVLDALSDALFVHEVGPDGTPGVFIDANAAACRRLGYTREEMLRMSLRQIDAPDAGIDIGPAVAELNQGRGVAFEQVHLTRDGRRIPVEVHARPAVMRGRRVVVSLARDITDRKLAEAALRESEERYRSLAEAAHDMIFIVNRDGYVEYANRFAAAQLGRQPDELVGLRLDAIFPSAVATRQGASLRRVCETIQPAYIENTTVFPFGEVWLGTWLVPMRVENGRARAVLGIARDITERKRTEQALRDSEERFRSLFLEAPDAIFVESMEGRVLDVNPAACRLHGMSREQMVGLPVAALVPVEDRGEFSGGYAKVVAGQWTHFESRSLRADGAVVPVDIHVSRIQYDGRPALLFQVRDISLSRQAEAERRALELQVQHAQKLESLGVLAGGIAHDFNNILMAILGYCDLAIGDLSPASPVRDNLQEVEKAARRAADLCRQLLAYSGRGQFVMEPVDLSELVREMSHLLEVAISKKVVLRFDLARGMPSLQVDATQVRQVVMNLVINASEAIGDRSGVVALSTGIMECAGSAAPGVWMLEPPTTGCCAYFDVADTGCGMDANTLARIFDPFFSTKFTGRGLGLAAVLGIVRGHGGGLRVASEVGKGTTFRVALPVSEVPAAAVETSGEAVRWRSSGTVLVVDDEETVRVLAKLMLTRLGFQVLTAVDGRDAVATFGRQAEAIRCVILDVTMPHMDGVETLLALRAIRADVPILLSSGYTEQDVAMRAAAHEVSGFVQKPYTLKALAAKLRQALEPVQT